MHKIYIRCILFMGLGFKVYIRIRVRHFSFPEP